MIYFKSTLALVLLILFQTDIFAKQIEMNRCLKTVDNLSKTEVAE